MTETVILAVLTYRRPGELATLLPRLLAQAEACPRAVRVLVIDNDPSGSAADVVSALACDRVKYVHERRPGIAAARNRALEEAEDDQLLVFIDDDEEPVPGWLTSLLAVHASTGSAAVVGPVLSQYEQQPEPWVAAGAFFARRRLPTGTPVEVAATNNLLLDLRQVRRLGVRFDERFGLSGGSDTLFTRQIAARGGSLVWCDEAVVVDRVPAERLTRRWVLLRALRSGNSWSRTSMVLAADSAWRRARTRVELTARGGLRTVAGAGQTLLGVLTRSAAHQARGLRTGARGVGMLLGAYGIVYSEYRRSSQPSPTHDHDHDHGHDDNEA